MSRKFKICLMVCVRLPSCSIENLTKALVLSVFVPFGLEVMNVTCPRHLYLQTIPSFTNTSVWELNFITLSAFFSVYSCYLFIFRHLVLVYQKLYVHFRKPVISLDIIINCLLSFL